MFGSQVLEVVIGVVLMYLLLSLICSSIREGIEACWKARAGDLQRGIRELFQDRELPLSRDRDPIELGIPSSPALRLPE